MTLIRNPAHGLPREHKDQVISAATAQYTRRGRPVEKTGWSVDTIHDYMRWQFNEAKCGRLGKKKLGGWAWKLPAKDESGEPAPLPAEVKAYVRSIKKKRGRSDSSDSGSIRSENPKSLYALDTCIEIKCMFVCCFFISSCFIRCAMSFRVDLGIIVLYFCWPAHLCSVRRTLLVDSMW